MNIDSFANRCRESSDLLAALIERFQAEDTPDTLAIAENLSCAIEELHVASEELQVQNSELTISRTNLEQERAHYQELFDLSPDAYLVTDSNGIIQEANASAAGLFNVSQTHLVGKPLVVFVCPDCMRGFISKLSAVNLDNPEALQNAELEICPRERAAVPVCIRTMLVRNADGILSKIHWTLRDITVRKEAEAHKLAAIAQRTEFLSALTHDLKEPIRSISRILARLLDCSLGELTDRQAELLRELLNANEKLLRMIESLLTVYKSERDGYFPIFTDTDLSDLIDACLAEVNNEAQQNGVKLSRALPDKKVVIKADGTMIRCLLQNLLENAFKFTPCGGTVEIVLQESGDQVVVEVRDTGGGISLEDQQHLFKRFRHITSGNKYSPGPGVGLYLCKQYVQAHNGTISCNSTPGKGTVFSVSLPYDQQ